MKVFNSLFLKPSLRNVFSFNVKKSRMVEIIKSEVKFQLINK